MTSWQALVALHLRLIKALASDKRARGMYELYVRQGLRQQEAVALCRYIRYGRGGARGGVAECMLR